MTTAADNTVLRTDGRAAPVRSAFIPEGIRFVSDFRPDRKDYTGYSAVVDSFVEPILAHLPAGFGSLGTVPQDGMLNVRFYTWPAQEHVFISHGIADKGYRSPAKVHGFRWVHVSGPWWTDYYIRKGPEGIAAKLIETGYPKLDPLFDGTIPRVPNETGKIRVLWAPTHAGINGRGRSYPSSFLELREDIHKLLPPGEFEIEIAPHPRLREQNGLPVKVTLEEYARADVVVADAGSTLYEAWALDLPVVLPDWIVKGKLAARDRKGTLEGLIYSERIAYHATGAGSLAQVIREAARDGLGERAIELTERILPRAYRGNGGELTAAALMEICEKPVPALHGGNAFWVVSPDGTSYEHVTAKAYHAVWKNKGYRPAAGEEPKPISRMKPGIPKG